MRGALTCRTDELDGRNPFAFGDIRGALPGSGFGQPNRVSGRLDPAIRIMTSCFQDARGPTLPPIQPGPGRRGTAYPTSSSSPVPASSSSSRYPSAGAAPVSSQTPAQRGGPPAGYRPPGPQGPHEYAYGVLRTSGSGSSLVHATPPAPRAQGILRQGGAPSQSHDEEPEKRHKCDYCGKKFDRPSSLQVGRVSGLIGDGDGQCATRDRCTYAHTRARSVRDFARLCARVAG